MAEGIFESIQRDYDTSGYGPVYPACASEEIMMEMGDGIRLKTFIFRPACEGGMPETKPLPLILQRSCYPGQMGTYKVHAENLTKRGYIYALQFCRGTGGSEGDWVPNVDERSDGLDTVNWLNGQEWVESIGYWGNSYLALTGWAIADRVPDKVKGMCLTHYGTDRFASAYEKGMFRQDVLTSWAMDNASFPVATDYTASCRYMPQVEVDEKLWGKRIGWYREWITSTRREDAYWQGGWWKELYDIPSRVKVPLYIRSGWYDHHHGSSMKTWDNLPEETKKKCRLDIGGWNHGFRPCLQDRATENAGSSEVLAILEWFDLILKQKRIPTQRIRTYVIGRDRWIEPSQWPEKPSDTMELYFGRKPQVESPGVLEAKAGHAEEVFTYEYAPSNPAPSHGVESLLKNMAENGSLIQPEPGYRADVVSFVSEPVEEAICIYGKMKVHLFVASDCPDTAFTAKVMEVRENGKSYNIRSSITSIRHDTGRAYEPGTVEEVTVDMWDIVYEVKKGSRLRIDISSSDFPQYNIHSNYAGVWALQDKAQKAVQKIYCGKARPSRIEIPVKMN